MVCLLYVGARAHSIHAYIYIYRFLSIRTCKEGINCADFLLDQIWIWIDTSTVGHQREQHKAPQARGSLQHTVYRRPSEGCVRLLAVMCVNACTALEVL